jgi:outer membrane protein OmpA-like peptidoglycan-associated protein
VALGLARARAVAEALAGLRVPQASIRVGADAFGRGAVLRLLP